MAVHDMELLRDYDRQGSEEAFAELVQRHVNLVYSIALRKVGVAAHAEEITQAVFVILARKAARLGPGTVLEGWLHETTRLTALSFLRQECRRRLREQQAYMESTLSESAETSIWNQLAPLLDEALSRLGEKDRDALMLRFFREQSIRNVAAALKVSEAAAQRRVRRAIEKLRRFFTKRGVVVTAGVLASLIPAHAVQAAPTALAGSATTVALAKGAAATGSTFALVQGALKYMAWTKAKTAAVAAVILAAAATTGVVGHNLVQAHRAKPPLMDMMVDVQADGVALTRFSIETVNTSKETWGTNEMASPMYSAMDIKRFTDANGQAVEYTKEPGDDGNPFKYTFALNHPVRPGGKLVLKMEGPVDGLIKPTGERDVFELQGHEQMGTLSLIHCIKVFRLPQGAVLLGKSPADLTTATNGDRIEVGLDKMLPPPGKSDVRIRYRLPSAMK